MEQNNFLNWFPNEAEVSDSMLNQVTEMDYVWYKIPCGLKTFTANNAFFKCVEIGVFAENCV